MANELKKWANWKESLEKSDLQEEKYDKDSKKRDMLVMREKKSEKKSWFVRKKGWKRDIFLY